MQLAPINIQKLVVLRLVTKIIMLSALEILQNLFSCLEVHQFCVVEVLTNMIVCMNDIKLSELRYYNVLSMLWLLATSTWSWSKLTSFSFRFIGVLLGELSDILVHYNRSWMYFRLTKKNFSRKWLHLHTTRNYLKSTWS